MQLDPEAVQIPKTFPIQARGAATKITNIDEPPDSVLPPPPPMKQPMNPNEATEYDSDGFRYLGDPSLHIRRAGDEDAFMLEEQEREAEADDVMLEEEETPPVDNVQMLRCLAAVRKSARDLQKQSGPCRLCLKISRLPSNPFSFCLGKRVSHVKWPNIS